MDIQTGINAGMRTALVLTGEAGKDKKYDVTPDLVCKDLFGGRGEDPGDGLGGIS